MRMEDVGRPDAVAVLGVHERDARIGGDRGDRLGRNNVAGRISVGVGISVQAVVAVLARESMAHVATVGIAVDVDAVFVDVVLRLEVGDQVVDVRRVVRRVFTDFGVSPGDIPVVGAAVRSRVPVPPVRPISNLTAGGVLRGIAGAVGQDVDPAGVLRPTTLLGDVGHRPIAKSGVILEAVVALGPQAEPELFFRGAAASIRTVGVEIDHDRRRHVGVIGSRSSGVVIGPDWHLGVGKHLPAGPVAATGLLLGVDGRERRHRRKGE